MTVITIWENNGLQRFVTGNYSHGQACALMVGALRNPKLAVVPPLMAEFAVPARAQRLVLVPASPGAAVHQPSNNFAAYAEFDTEHLRPAPSATDSDPGSILLAMELDEGPAPTANVD